MARARNIKPGFFKNEYLGTADPFVSLLFAGLWTLADKAGILEDRPLRIKAELFPYRDGFDINGYLTVLERLLFIHRYEVDGIKLIQIAKFSQHQNPHHTEKDSEYKSFDEYTKSCVVTVKQPLNNGITPADSLIPDSLIPDSLNTDSLLPAAPKVAAQKNEIVDTELQTACKQTWKAYSDAFFNRYSTEPVRNAAVNSQVKSFVQRIGHDESPLVAAFFLKNNSTWYVTKGHAFKSLLGDAEKIRTEWATGRSMTNTRAKQIDQTQANFSVVSEVMEKLERENNAKAS